MPPFTPELLLSSLASFFDAQIGWIAYSGGMDSTALLHAVVEIRDRLPFELHAVHVDHGLHFDSQAWSENCSRTCKGLRVPLRIRSVEVAPGRGESLEAVARHTRYKVMAELLGHDDLLLTAHHLDDQAETLLLALMRGSGPRGLAAMPRVAPLGAGWLVRPLLGYSRAALLGYAKRRRLRWVKDPSNRDLGFDRNFLRHRVLPLLAGRWPACATSIARSAAHCAEAQGIIDLVARDELAKVAGTQPGTLSIDRLGMLEFALCKAVLRHWLREQGQAPPDSRHLDRIISEVMTARADANPLVSWPGCEVRRYRDDLFTMTPLPSIPVRGPIRWDKGILSLPNGLGYLKLVDAEGSEMNPLDVYADGLEVRFGAEGLSCRLTPGGHRRPLKKLYQETAVPPWIRPYVPLIFVQGHLIAVGEAWICHVTGLVREREFRIRWKSEMLGGYLVQSTRFKRCGDEESGRR